jgi:hypothetical protein
LNVVPELQHLMSKDVTSFQGWDAYHIHDVVEDIMLRRRSADELLSVLDLGGQ